MALPPSGIVTVRLSPRDAALIDELVEDGHFTSRSDFIRYAVKATATALLQREGADESAVRPLEGPGSIPAASDGARRRARPSPNKGAKL